MVVTGKTSVRQSQYLLRELGDNLGRALLLKKKKVEIESYTNFKCQVFVSYQEPFGKRSLHRP